MQQKLFYFDPADRRRAKQRDREQDEFALQIGLVSAEALSMENGFFSGIDFSNASIRRPKRRA